MFKYIITDQLLENIRRINNVINELNNKRFPEVVLLGLEKNAREVSAYASTSIGCNPLPLTEVKKILKSHPAHIWDSEKEVLNYDKVLQNLNRQIEEGKVRLSLHLILKIQKEVTDKLLSKYESGSLRKKPVIVNDPGVG